jgi:predicted O-methyltransferase YrrM
MIPYCQTLTGVDLDANAGSYMESTSKVNFVNMSSHDYWKTSHGNLFDFIMIDANHSKESVEEDFHNGLRLLGEDGLLLLHDTYPESEEATISDRCDDGYLFIGEASLDSRDYEMVTLPRHPGLTICRKRSKQVPWMQ